MTVEDVDIVNYIRNWFACRNDYVSVDDNVDYYVQGLIDSFGIFEMIDHLEERYPIRFDDQDFREPAFRTVVGLAGLIERKLKSTVGED